ncbi:conserved hypothetical protein [Mesorhizobium plurifarium]|uniref:DUF4435 domain-containing protein n=1 Tax=Mesorhizobium plurifarium TaxID=69974 RepID=A0A090GAJ8_MESPL|nr:conserved hypothetical protein [Mesorhizobium plurifarium]
MVRYSEKAAKALGYLKKKYNSIEVYVEDTASQAVWMRILKSILPAHTKIRSVNMLGGRESVTKACRLDQKQDGRRKLYIIDGDLDFVRGLRKENLRFLYRLRAYCVENLLLAEESLTEIALDSDGSQTSAEARNSVSYRHLLSKIGPSLKKLFVLYATAIELKARVKTVSYSVTNLLESTRHAVTLSADKVRQRCFWLLREICRQHSVRKVRATRKAFEANAMHLPLEMVVSGKDYLLPFIHLHLARCCGFRGTETQLKVQLARNFSARSEPYFARRLRQLAA